MGSKYDFTGHNYSVRRISNKEILHKEMTMLRNCILSPISPYLRSKTPVLLLRKTDRLDEPFITISISRNGKIREVRGKNNSFASPDVYLFLEAYSRYKGIGYDPVSIILEDELVEYNETDIELSRYIYYYIKRHDVNRIIDEKKNIGECEYESSLKDFFPEIMDNSDNKTREKNPIEDCFGYDFSRIIDSSCVPSNEIDRFIWDHLDEAYIKNEEKKKKFNWQLSSMLTEKEVNYDSFQQIWKLSEAYSLWEIDRVILDLYGEYLIDDERAMLSNRWKS